MRLFQLRFFLALVAFASVVHGAVPAELAAALMTFRADAPRGWSFTQTTTAEGKSLVERCDATKSEFDRWSLVQKDGRAPTAEETSDYAVARSRRSRGGTAPKLIEQLDLNRLEIVVDAGERATYRCPVRPGEAGDKTAPFLRATLVLHKPTRTLETIELGSTQGFAPTFGVSIAEMKTVLSYALPVGDTPALPQKVATRVRGRAFLFKSLDADMTVTFSAYEKAGKK